MKGRIETACFHCSGGREMIYASNREAEWLNHVMDVRTCYDKLFDKTSGTSIVLLSPTKTGIMLVISKMIPNRFGDNLTAYLKLKSFTLVFSLYKVILISIFLMEWIFLENLCKV